ncbi:MAG: glycosyltransferase family 39 protein [Chloroflexi bacterium]|nr:glycosyltransferase family 39 protein [Chloroflexota bacterium]
MNLATLAATAHRLLSRRNLLTVVALAAYVVRLARIDAMSLWYDEAFSAWLSAQSLGAITERTAADIHPPLYYYILHYWTLAVGQSEFSLRYLSLASGVLCVPLFYHLGRRLLGEPAGWIAAVLAALSPMYVWYSQEARMYMPTVLFVLLSAFFFWRWLARPTWLTWIAWTLANLVAVYLHFYAFFIVAFQVIYFFYWWVRQETHWGMLFVGLTSSALVCLSFAPWAQFALARFAQDESYFEGVLSMGEVARKTLILFSTGQTMLEADALLPALVFGLLAIAGWFAAARLQRDPVAPYVDNPFRLPLTTGAAARVYLLLWLVMPVLLMWFISYGRPKFHPRYLMIASPAFLLFVAATLAALGLAFWRSAPAHAARRYTLLSLAAGCVAVVASTVVSGLINLYTDPQFMKDDFRSAVATIRSQRSPSEPTILVSGHMYPVYQYYDPQGRTIPLPDSPTLSTRRVLGYNVANELNQALSGATGAWLVLWQDEIVDPGGFVRTILDTQAQRVGVDSFWGVDVLHYVLAPGTVFRDKPQIQYARTANFGGQIELLGYNLPPAAQPADQGIAVTVYWRALADLTRDYQVSLRALDSAGRLVGKLDARPATYDFPTTRWRAGDIVFGALAVPLDPGTPPGEYSLEVQLYAADDLQTLDVLDAAGNPAGRTIVSDPIRIERAQQPPPLEKIKPARLMRYNVAGVIDMIGYELDRDAGQPGEPIQVTIYWRALATPKDDYRVQFLISRSSAPTESFTGDAPAPLVSGYPTSQWHTGEIVKARYTFYVPSDAAEGDRTLRMTIMDRLGTTVGASVSVGNVKVEPSTRIFQPTRPRVTQQFRFSGNEIMLYGYDLTPTPALSGAFTGTVTLVAGDSLRVDLHWRAVQRVRAGYKVFVQVRSTDGPPLAQDDSVPAGGARPTVTWVPGEYLVDTHDLRLPKEMPPGNYVIEVGLYDARTGERLSLAAPGAPNAARLGVRLIVR